MLKAAPKGSDQGSIPIHPDEDRVLRQAFGRYGGSPAARAAAAPIVAHYQQANGGHWFFCDCRPGGERQPVLVPVSQTHLRRHQDERWPSHQENCDLYRDPGEQRLLTASYGPLPRGHAVRLVRRLNQVAAPPLDHQIEGTSYQRRRPGIGRLLVQMVTAAGLQRLEPGKPVAPLGEQFKAIWAAAKAVSLDTDVALPDFLCTSPGRLGELVERLERAPATRFAHTRPHGVLIARIASVERGFLHPVVGEPIPVAGRLGVFGATADEGRESRAERAARAPYLAACVIARAKGSGPFEVLSAYAHPCASDDHLMLVDSNLERQTLAQLVSLQRWLLNRQEVGVTIEKPMADIGLAGDGAADPRPPIIPDFVVRLVNRATGKEGRAAVVETMGFASDAYRARKARVHPFMSAALEGAPVVEHDFYRPGDWSQKDRNETFWQDVRRAVTGHRASAARHLVSAK